MELWKLDIVENFGEGRNLLFYVIVYARSSCKESLAKTKFDAETAICAGQLAEELGWECCNIFSWKSKASAVPFVVQYGFKLFYG